MGSAGCNVARLKPQSVDGSAACYRIDAIICSLPRALLPLGSTVRPPVWWSSRSGWLELGAVPEHGVHDDGESPGKRDPRLAHGRTPRDGERPVLQLQIALVAGEIVAIFLRQSRRWGSGSFSTEYTQYRTSSCVTQPSMRTVRVWTPLRMQGGVREICSRRFRCFRVSGLLMQPSSRLLACMEIADRVHTAFARSRRLDSSLVFPTPSSDRCAIPLY